MSETITREEYLAALPDPISREEYFLAAAAGMDVGQLPEPITRREQYLARIAAGGGGSGTGGETAGTAVAAVSRHNVSSDAHGDLRLELRGLSLRLNAFLDADDQTLDELSEIVSYIKNNKTLIEGITAGKVNVSDIADSLTVNAGNRPLSAAQGVVLKGLIDAVNESLDGYALKEAIPARVGQLENDAGYLTEHQDISGKLDAAMLEEAVNSALTQAKSSGMFDGQDGYTPIKGEDYYTEGEKAAWQDYIAGEVARQGQAAPEYADSVAECTDTGKLYVLPDGFLYAYMLTEGEAYTNVISTAVDVDGTPYNGGKGYKTGARFSTSSGTESASASNCCTGFIPVKKGDTIRIKNMTRGSGNGSILWFLADRVAANRLVPPMYEEEFASCLDGDVYVIPAFDSDALAYFVLSTGKIDDSTIITINEEITEGGATQYAWKNTGHAFVPADYEDAIVELQTDVSRLKNRVNSLEADNGNTGTAVTDSVEILLPSEAVAVVGVEFNIYHKSIIRASRNLDNYDVKIYLNDNSVSCRRYAECFRLTAEAEDVGDYTLTVEVRNLKDYAVVASKAMTLHIIANTPVTGKNVLFLGDSLTFSRAGLYAAEIQHNLSGGGMVSVGTQNGGVETNQTGNVKHEGYNGATCGGFLQERVTSGFANPFYNPAGSGFDLAYYMENNGYTKVDAVCLNLGHNNLGNEAAGVADLKAIIDRIHVYDANIPVLVSLITPVGDQDAWCGNGHSAAQMRYHWRQLIKAYITAFDNGKIRNVYLTTPYFNVDQDNDFPTETMERSARDTAQIIRQTDCMHPTRIGTLKMADSYYAYLLYHLA